MIRTYTLLQKDNYKMRCYDWFRVADSFYNLNKISKCIQALDSAQTMIRTQQDSLYLGKLMGLILAKEGKYQDAFYTAYNWGQKIMDATDEDLTHPNNIIIQENYHLTALNRKAQILNLKTKNLILILTTIITALTLSLFIIILIQRVKAKNRNLSQLSEQFYIIQENLNNLSKLAEEKDIKTKAIVTQNLNLINETCEKWFITSETKKQSVAGRNNNDIVAVITGGDNVKVIADIINVCSNGLISEMQSAIPDFKTQYYLLSCYLYAGFSNEAIAALLGKPTTNAVRQEKHRLKKYIHEHLPEQAEELFKKLGI